MRALTLMQPWATLVLVGAKRIETRSWRVTYRGPLAIHAAKRFPKDAKDLCQAPGFSLALAGEQLPLGVVLATCRLIACIPTRELQRNRTIEADPVANASNLEMTDQERLFGNYTPGRWAWLLSDVKPLQEPVPTKGALGLWNWNP